MSSLCRICSKAEGPDVMLTKLLRLWSVFTGSRFSDEKLNSRPSQLPGGMDRTCMLIPLSPARGSG